MKILLIAFYYEPFMGVGGQRCSYWGRHLNKLSDSEIDVDVVTATKQDVVKDNVLFIPANGKSLFSFFIKDEGVNWIAELKSFLNSIDVTVYASVIMSGGPFMHFEVSGLIKKLSPKTKIILDFRDPFALNPRFNNNFFKTYAKRILEKRFIKMADFVVTVNQHCASLLDMSAEKKINIIDNGFDNTKIHIMDGDVDHSAINFIYAGSFYSDRSPIFFIKALNTLSNQKFIFKHVGNDTLRFLQTAFYPRIEKCGFKSYSEAMEILAQCQVGLIFTGGEPFESTTKVFDYMGMQKIVLIITNGEVHTGELHRITEQYPHCFWAKNSESDIVNVIDKIHRYILESKHLRKINVDMFSRKYGAQKLIKLLKSNHS